MAWQLAPSLVNFRGEIHSTWPNHDRTSDGSIGDADHSSSVSDHNPNSRGMVCAIDEDKDGLDMERIIDAFERHPSSHYWIFKFPGSSYPVIADRDNGWKRVRYYGDNPHDKHAHFSIRQSSSAEQNQTPWGIEEEEMDQATFNERMDAWVKRVYTCPDNSPDTDLVATRNYMRAFAWNYIDKGQPSAHNIVLGTTGTLRGEIPETLKTLNDKLDALLAIPPGTVTVDQKQLEDAVREVMGSVDEFPVQ